jgi:signal transduction histidine kinase
VLLTIVNDILDLATVDAGIMQLDIGEVRVASMIEAACELVAERLREHDISIRAELPDAAITFRADENRVRQVLFNLLTNASNYAPRGSAVLIKAARAGDMVEFRVHDDGPGIAPDVLETIYSRFEPRSRGGRRRGAGLGLSVVKSFVELHGGTVEIETGSDRGTTVICRFPLTPASLSEAAE